jgi:hypothetical protein
MLHETAARLWCSNLRRARFILTQGLMALLLILVQCAPSHAQFAANNKPTPTATKKPTPTATKKPTPTATKKPTPTATKKPTPTGTKTPTPTATEKPTPTATEKPTPTATEKPTPTATEKPTPTATEKPTPTATEKPTPTATRKPTSTPTRAPAPTPVGPEPGLKDPVGSASNYQSLRADDLTFFTLDSGRIFQPYTYQIDNANRLSSLLNIPLTSLFESNPGFLLTASGRVSTQDRDDVVAADTSPCSTDRNNQCVRIRLMPGLNPRVVELPGPLAVPSSFQGPPLIALAAGDLDQVPDAEGVDHDDVAVAWASNVSADQSTVDVNLAVVNYTSEKPVVTVLPNAVRLFPGLLRSGQNPLTDQLFAVAMGDFAGDGQTELALAAITGGGEFEGQFWRLQIYRYSRTSLTSAPVLTKVSDAVYNYISVLGRDIGFTPTISLVAGDFKGDGKKDELMVALNLRVLPFGSTSFSRNFLKLIELDSNLRQSEGGEALTEIQNLDGMTNQTRIKAVPGLFVFDPARGLGLYGRQVAVAYNDRRRLDDPSAAQRLNIETYSISPNLRTISPLTAPLHLDNKGVDTSFDLVAGGFAVNGRMGDPTWSLAVSQLKVQPRQTVNSLSMVRPSGGLGNPTGLSVTSTGGNTACSSCPFSSPSNRLRWSLTADDYQGRSVRFGAPVHFRINRLVNTDFVLQEPPKHAYWDPKDQKVVNVSRFPTIQTSLKTMEGRTFEGKSKDTSGYSIGGSVKISASASAQAGESNTIGSAKISVDVANKTSYNYDWNHDTYNSNYSERTLTEATAAENDDVVTGRLQTFDIWRYRVLGVPKVTAQSENPPKEFQANAFYDIVLPGPELKFSAGGLDLDWYHPLHENGNILSYPAPSDGTFNPTDLGTFDIPCPSADKSKCNADGTLTVSEPIIPSSQRFVNATSESIAIDYGNKTGSGDSIKTDHKLANSTDVKAGVSVQLGGKENNVTKSGSVEVNFSAGGNWSNLNTTDSITTNKTGITVGRTSIASKEAYAFYPVFYATEDGTIKVAHAADPLGSNAGKSFWSNLYGKKADPALNLPLRFTREGTAWIPNRDISRKQIRGFYLLTVQPNPITGQFDILGLTPVTGDKVRLSVQVYNYSTGVAFSDCEVKFSAIKYNPIDNTESGPLLAIGTTHVSLNPRGNTAAQVIWDTTKFGPATQSASQTYRIYVQLNYNGAIDEIYPPEDPNQIYGPGLPKGLDPGQNDEGFGYATVMAPAVGSLTASQTTKAPLHLYLGSQALKVGGPQGYTADAGLLVEQAGAQVALRVQVCGSQPSRDIADVVVFDGPPAEGNVVAWKRVPVTDGEQCDYAWFQWVPSVRGEHTLVTEVLQDQDDPQPGQNQASLNVEVVGP